MVDSAVGTDMADSAVEMDSAAEMDMADSAAEMDMVDSAVEMDMADSAVEMDSAVDRNLAVDHSPLHVWPCLPSSGCCWMRHVRYGAQKSRLIQV
jgi:hypothetical protein